MIGVNTAILSESGASAGIGFAIPVNTVNRVVPGLIANGTAPAPGIGIVSASPNLASQLGLAGVIVLRVLPGTPAAQAGLQPTDLQTGTVGDVITAVNGTPVQSVAQFVRQLDAAGIGNVAHLTVERDGQSRTVDVRVGDMSALRAGG